MSVLHNFMFVVLPYLAVVVFVVGCIFRFRTMSYKVSSLSSQFLESEKLFWGSVPFHFGMLVVFLGHLVAFLFPKTILAWNAYPVRLLILEGTGFVFALCFLFGLIVLFVRRVTNPRIRVVTNKMDIAVEILLLYQVILGCLTALCYRWGSSWFAADLSPYLWSLVQFNPNIEAVSAMPHLVQAHIVGAYLLMLMIPFTRLVHFLAAPLQYLWRPYQQVIWNWDRKKINRSDSPWSHQDPKNT